MKKVILIIVIVVVVCVFGFLAIKGCQTQDGNQPLNTATVERGNISKTVVATGKIEPLYKAGSNLKLEA